MAESGRPRPDHAKQRAGLAEEFLAADESDGAKRVAATKAWLTAAASDPYFTETTVEQRDAVRDEAWS
jgi:hypothetical protein